jgi:3',5'-cyclic AMP phosphodiesterase CpdA
MADEIIHDHHHDGIDRRGFLKCMAWAGTGVALTFSGGVVTSHILGQGVAAAPATGDFTFVQISDSHIGFHKAPNTDVTATFQQAVDKINRLPTPPAFTLHTGDLSHLQKLDEWDTLDQLLKGAKGGEVFFTPGEHDVAVDNGKSYLTRYGKGTTGEGWRSFDYKGVHFVGLVNVLNLKAGGLGYLGPEQIDWLKQDLAGLSSSTPVVVYAHIPLWAVYPKWGWGTDDSEQVLALLRRFGSVTVLNGHIHQVLHKIEGNITFHTAYSTAFPQPAPGTAPAPGPLVVPAGKLKQTLGIHEVSYRVSQSALAIVDSTLD